MLVLESIPWPSIVYPSFSKEADVQSGGYPKQERMKFIKSITIFRSQQGVAKLSGTFVW